MEPPPDEEPPSDVFVDAALAPCCLDMAITWVKEGEQTGIKG